MPELNEVPKDLSNLARDAAYVVVGLGVLGLQRAQVQRQALRKKMDNGELDSVLSGLRHNVGRSVHEVDAALEQGIRQVEAAVKPIEQQLPSPVRELLVQGHTQARELRSQIRQLVESAV